MVLSHLDKDALRQITGSENNYLAAMRKLHEYFGNKLKVTVPMKVIISLKSNQMTLRNWSSSRLALR